MSSINYDPDNVPEIDNRLLDKAMEYNMQLVHVVCDEEGMGPGDLGGVSFHALVPTVPRVGELIQLQDKKMCRVHEVWWRVSTDTDGHVFLFANVFAKLAKQKNEQT